MTSNPAAIATRDELYAAIDSYLAALAAKDISRVAWADDVVFTENNVQLMLGDGLWNTITKVRDTYDVKAADPQTGQASWFGIIEETDDAAVMAMRIAMKQGKITEVETLVCRPSELGPFPQIDDARRPRPVLAEDVPEDQRRPRERLIAIADGYFDTLQNNDGTLFTDFTDECDRIENGLQTTNVDIEGYPISKMGCADQFRLGQYIYDDRLRDRRFPLVDEEKGIVIAAGFIDHSGRLTDITWTDGSRHKSIFTFPHSFALLELFKIVDGKIAEVEAVFVTVPYNMTSPWVGKQPYVVR